MADDPNEWEAAAPAPSTWGDTVNDFGRAVTNAATFGMGNRMKAGIEYLKGNAPSYSEGVDAQAKASEVARERSPYASIAGDVYGSFAIPALGAENLALRSGAALAPTLGRAAPAVGRAVGYGATGAATGAAQGAGNTYSGELPDYIQNAAIGGVLGGAFGGAGGAAFGRGPEVSRARTPSQQELWTAKTGGYDALGRSGARYEGPALAQRADDIERQLFNERYHPRDSPGTFRGVEEARGPGAPGQLPTGYGAPVDPGNIDFIIKGLNKIPQGEARATDRESARIVKRQLNDFIENPPPGAVLPGTEAEARHASTLARNARGDYAGYKRVQAVDELINNAANTTGATHSGLNLQNELKKGVRTFIKETDGISPASKRGFNRDEIAALTNYTRGTNATNLMRWGSNALGGGGGLGTQVALIGGGGAGAAAGQYFKDDPMLGSAIGPASVGVGATLRMLGNRRANREIAGLRDMIAQRTPLYQYRQSMAGTQPGPGSPNAAKGMRDAIAAAIMQRQPTPQTGPQPDDPREWE